MAALQLEKTRQVAMCQREISELKEQFQARHEEETEWQTKEAEWQARLDEKREALVCLQSHNDELVGLYKDLQGEMEKVHKDTEELEKARAERTDRY